MKRGHWAETIGRTGCGEGGRESEGDRDRDGGREGVERLEDIGGQEVEGGTEGFRGRRSLLGRGLLFRLYNGVSKSFPTKI